MHPIPYINGYHINSHNSEYVYQTGVRKCKKIPSKTYTWSHTLTKAYHVAEAITYIFNMLQLNRLLKFVL